jgi:hypothetical protein
MTYIRLIFCALLANISLYGMDKNITRAEANLKFDLLLRRFGYQPGVWMKDNQPFWFPVIRDTSIPLDKTFFEIYRERGGDLNACAHLSSNVITLILNQMISIRCEPDLVRCLLELGIDASLTSNRNYGCLHALQNWTKYEEHLKVGECEDIVGLLIRHGAAINGRDMNGWTPIDCALQAYSANIAKLLRKHGAECTQDICDVNLKYALICQKPKEETQLFIAGFWWDYQRKRFLIAALSGLMRMPFPLKEIRKKIISFLPDCVPDYCLSRVYPESRVKVILEERHQEKIRLINELKLYVGAAPRGDIWNLMNELKGDAKAPVSNANAYANPASDLGKTKKCSIQ